MPVMTTAMDNWKLHYAGNLLRKGGVIAYPTEAVYGLGCDPLNAAAVLRILDMKQRPEEKGLILVAANLQQLQPYLLPLSHKQQATLQHSWPGPNTWIVPARPEVPRWLRGKHDSLAVRVSAHPWVQALCHHFGGPIVSTSANRAGQEPARTPLQVRIRLMGNEPDLILHAPLGGAAQPTKIRDLLTGSIVRMA